MNGTMNRTMKETMKETMNCSLKASMRPVSYEGDEAVVSENCNFSAYSMAAVAGGILLCIGIVLYALLTA